MQDELVAAYPDGDMEAIMQPRRDRAIGLSNRISAFLTARTDVMEPGPAREEAVAADAKSVEQIRRLPDVIKSVVLRGLAAAAAQPAMPAPTDESASGTAAKPADPQ